MTDWATILILAAFLPVDALVVSYLMAWFLARRIAQIWQAEQAKKKKKPWWKWWNW